MTWKDVIADTSAGTLGYITGNLPGAVIGYSGSRAYRKGNFRNFLIDVGDAYSNGLASSVFTKKKQMAAIKRTIRGGKIVKKVNYVPNPAYPFSSKRERVRSIFHSKKKHKGSRMPPKKGSSDPARDVIVRHKGKKLKRFGKKKIRVSRKFAAGVRQVMDGKSFHGTYVRRMTQITKLSSQTNNQQYVLSGAASGGAFIIGSPNQLMDAFSILWRNKTPDVNWLTTTGNFSAPDSSTTSSTFNFKGDVLRCWMDLQIYNSSTFPVDVEVVKCTSRLYSATDPSTDWTAVLASESPVTNMLTVAGPNIKSHASTQFGTRPYNLPAWRKRWKHEIFKIQFEPGQRKTISHKLGRFSWDQRKFTPQSQTHDPANYVANVPRQTTWFLVIASPALDCNKAGTVAGRYWPSTTTVYAPNQAAANPTYVQSTNEPALVFELVNGYNLLCPEQTLDVVPALDGNAHAVQQSQETLKQDAYVYYMSEDTLSGGQEVVNPNQPSTFGGVLQ